MIKPHMKTRLWVIALLVMAVLLAGIPAVSAFTVTQVSPTDTNLFTGQQIQLRIDNLAVNDVFTYQITSDNMNPTGNIVTINNVIMPFSMANGNAQTTLTTTGLSAAGATLTVTRTGGAGITLGPGNPLTHQGNINADTYNVAIEGTKTGNTVGIDYEVTGTVTNAGTNPSTLSLTMADVAGLVTIEVFQDGTSVFQQTFNVIQTPEPQPTIDPADQRDGPSGPAPGPAAGPVAPAQLAPPGVSGTSVTFQQNEQGQVLGNYVLETDPAAGFESQLDIEAGTQIVSATGAPVNEISVTPLDPATTPEQAGGNVYSFSGFSVECEPSGTQFVGGSVTISFDMTDQQWADALAAVNGNTAAMTIEFYDAATQTWVEVPTTVDPVTHTVSAQVTHFSTYALFYKPVTGTALKTFGEMVQQTPTSTPMVTATGTQAPAPMLAPTETPAQEGGILDGLFKWISGIFGGK